MDGVLQRESNSRQGDADSVKASASTVEESAGSAKEALVRSPIMTASRPDGRNRKTLRLRPSGGRKLRTSTNELHNRGKRSSNVDDSNGGIPAKLRPRRAKRALVFDDTPISLASIVRIGSVIEVLSESCFSSTYFPAVVTLVQSMLDESDVKVNVDFADGSREWNIELSRCEYMFTLW